MTRYFLLICCSILTACNSEKTAEKKIDSVTSYEDTTSIATHHQPREDVKLTYLDSIKRNILVQGQSVSDSLFYTFSLEGNFSAEGNEGKAYYKGNKIDKIEITFYGETGKSVFYYEFKGSQVNVTQQLFNYRTNFTDVKSNKDILKAKRIEFSTDLEGKLKANHNTEADLDTFYEIKKAVPFDLN